VKNLRLEDCVTLTLLLLFASSCSMPKYVADPASTRRAAVRGELKEALASYESEAQEAEKKL